MSNPPAPSARPGPVRSVLRRFFTAQGRPGELVIISHSNLFYWWPVWLTGFVMAAVTYFQHTTMAVVPRGTVAVRDSRVQLPDGKEVRRDVLIAPAESPLPEDPANPDAVRQPRARVAQSKEPGVLFAAVVLLVIAVTNIPLRGLWSLLTVLVVFLWVIIFAQMGVWGHIFAGTRLLAIYLNMAGYLFLSVTLFLIWLVGLLFFDRQFYVIVTPGQVRVHLEIGGGETAYDTTGMVFQKKRSDIFRHWVLGFGSGDLVIRPSNSREHIELPNVTFVTRRVRAIETRLKEKEIVAA